MRKKGYSLGRLPASRRSIIDYLAVADKKHTVSALFELDVTEARRAVRAYRRRTGRRLSLSVYILHLYTRAIDRHRIMHRAVYKKNRYADFDDVDCAVLVERVLDGAPSASTRIIRAADKRSLDELMTEIDDAVHGREPELFSGRKKFSPQNLAQKLPRFLRLALLRYTLLHNPAAKKQLFGTVSFTAVSMFAQGSGWGVPITPHPLNFILGGIETRPRYIGGELQPRDILSVTMTMDHDLIDGAVSVRFLDSLKKMLIELPGLNDGLNSAAADSDVVNTHKQEARRG